MGPRAPDLRDATLIPFVEKIRSLYSSMDEAYTCAAERAGFICRGCSESCCGERFYHYTLAEHLYLLEGLHTLDRETVAKILDRAVEAVRIHRVLDFRSAQGHVVCPLCAGGLCTVYTYRPMICRLHGIPHTLKKGGTIQTGPGCHKFEEEAEKKDPAPLLDRTEFYSGMAAIEIELRRLTGFASRYKKTVAEMIVDGFVGMDKTRSGVLL